MCRDSCASAGLTLASRSNVWRLLAQPLCSLVRNLHQQTTRQASRLPHNCFETTCTLELLSNASCERLCCSIPTGNASRQAIGQMLLWGRTQMECDRLSCESHNRRRRTVSSPSLRHALEFKCTSGSKKQVWTAHRDFHARKTHGLLKHSFFFRREKSIHGYIKLVAVFTRQCAPVST